MTIEDDTKAAPKADPMAAARAAKARKALEKAEADSALADEQAASAAGEQPVLSSRKGKPEAVDEGDFVPYRVTFKGHGQISSGGDFGFERYARGAIVRDGRERNVRDLYNKGWAEPLDERYADKWEKMTLREMAEGARRKNRHDEILKSGVGAGEHWTSAQDG